MASISSELTTLRAITFRISSTSTAQLPQHVPAIASTLVNCRTLLSSTQGSTSKAASNSEASVSLHKYRTLLSTLLQDRTPQGRWAAVVLIKATIEAGGWETLQKALPWVRGLLGILTKPDPPSLKKLCIITLARIFMLTREFPTLIREITTPSLPTFVQSCLQIATSKSSNSLLQVVLESFNELLPRHPTIFRSYLKQLQPLLVRLIAPTPTSKLGPEQTPGGRLCASSDVVLAAQQLYAQLSCCAPKGGSSEEWQKTFKGTISAAHQVADKIFRAVHEEWQLTSREPASTNNNTLDDEVQDLEQNHSGLPPWSGIFAGSERLIGLLQVLQKFLDSSTPNPVYLNVATLMDLLSRLLSLIVPAASGTGTAKINNQVSKEERENMWSILPNIHVATVDVLLSLINRSQSSTTALDALVLDQLTWLFNSENKAVQVRTACYTAITTLLQRSGAALPKSSIDSLTPVMRACCEDILPSEISIAAKEKVPTKTNGNTKPQATANADTFLSSSKASSDVVAGLVGLKEAARNLLPALLANVRAQYLSDSMRARLDRTAILTQHKDAMINSVLNPPPSKKFGKAAASILPLMARSFPAESAVESILRPRMPVIRLGSKDAGLQDEEVEEEEVEELNDEAEEEGDDVATTTLNFAQKTADQTGQDIEMAETHLEEPTHIDAPKQPETIAATMSTADPMNLESSLSKDTSKRPHADDPPPSPSKRVKPTEQESDIAHPVPPVVAVPSRVTRASAAASEVPATSDFTVSSTASVIPELPTPSGEAVDEDDSDEDDVIPLVLGQDTDDESE